jgi:hypothetical protein
MPPRSERDLSGAAVTIRAVVFFQFFLYAHVKECRRPLADEQGPVILAHHFEYGGSGHRADGSAEIARGWNSGGLRFNPGGELVFTLASHTGAGGKCHEMETPLEISECDDKRGNADVMSELEFELVPAQDANLFSIRQFRPSNFEIVKRLASLRGDDEAGERAFREFSGI